MTKRLVLLLAVALLAAAAVAADSAMSAASTSKTIKITKTGYSPTTVSIIAGDAVVFDNTDTVAHTVTFKPTTGIKCSSALPLVIAAAKTASCTFSNTGTFRFSDPANKGKGFHGSVSVAAPPDVSLTVTPKSVVYGGKVTLSGKLASQASGQSLQVMAQDCGTTTAKKLTTVTTTTGGAFTTQATPLMQTTYTVKSKASTSLPSTVKVRPLMQLRKVAKHRYSLTISAAQSFAGKYATFQRYVVTTKRWRSVKQVLLKANTTGTAPTVLTTAKFKSRLKAKLRVRAVLKQTQVGTCYAAGRSNTIRS